MVLLLAAKCKHRGIDTPWVCPNTITLDVQFPPVINVPPYRCVKNGTQLGCEYTPGNPPTTQVKWKTPNDETAVRDNPLTIGDFEVQHSGNYTCIVNNTFFDGSQGRDVGITMVEVQYNPIVSTPVVYDIKEGEELKLDCSVKSVPAANEIIWSTPSGSIYRGNTLTLLSVRRGNAGLYTCHATNTFCDDIGGHGTGTSSTVVSVKFKPTSVELSAQRPSRYEGPVTLTCSTDCSNPAATIDWYVNGGLVDIVSDNITVGDVIETECENGGFITSQQLNIRIHPGDNDMQVKCSALSPDFNDDKILSNEENISASYSPLPIESGFEGDKITKNEHTDTLTSKPSKSTLYQHVTTTRFRMISERTHNQRDGVKLKYMKISVAIIGVSLVAVIAVTTVVVRSIRKRSKSQRETGRAGDYEEILETEHEIPRTAVSAEIIPLRVVPISDGQTQIEQSDDNSDSSDSGYMNLIDERKSQTYMKPWTSILEFQRDRLHIVKTISVGKFQTVLKGFAWCIDGKDGPSEVIVKRENDDLDAKFKGKISNEIQLLRRIPGHIYITKPIGCCTGMGPTYLIFEYAPCGSLKAFLKANRRDLANASVEVQDRLLDFAVCIASGMKHLAELEIVHRYLASKHILVYEGGVCKISNFSYASDVIDADMFFEMNQDKLPYKWMAVESLVNKEFTSMTDVWSFGVVLWEIFSLGSVPYRKLSRTSMLSLLDKGHRLVKPDLCRKEIFEIMLSCWKWSAVSRPTFAVIREQLQALLDYKDRPPVGVNIESTSVGTAEQK
ncbi:uncharacterized protein [Ptychodera flava]|uniref:uncharacterized protein n=1 Tax=Ptychodera flava TaxID=63121 RepID=UPI00396A669F